MDNHICIDIRPRTSDYIQGVNSPIVFKAVTSDWTPYITFFERQKFQFETDGCVLFTAQESFDAQINQQIENGSIPQSLLDWFTTNGYMDANSLDGKPHFHSSARFLHVLAGTRFNGTSLPTPWDTMRQYGVLPWTDLPYDETTTVDEYFAPITAVQLAKASQFLAQIGGKNSIQYHWVANGTKSIAKMQSALPQAPLCLGTAVCEPWDQLQPPTCSLTDPAHSTMTYKIDNFVEILDHYDPFEKELGLDYPIPYVLQGVLTVNVPAPAAPIVPAVPALPPTVQPTQANVSILQQIVSLYQQLLAILKGRNLGSTNMSQTQLSNFATAAGVLALLLQHLGIIIPPDNIAFILFSAWSVGWTAYNYWQRYQKGDLTLGGVRKAATS